MQEAKFLMLPNVTPLACAGLVLVAQAPVLAYIARSPRPELFPRAAVHACLCRCASTCPIATGALPSGAWHHAAASSPVDSARSERLAASAPHAPCAVQQVVHVGLMLLCVCSFLLGFHVHEKAILMVVVPMALNAADSPWAAGEYLYAAVLATYSLFPLLFTPTEYPIKVGRVLPVMHASTSLPGGQCCV